MTASRMGAALTALAGIAWVAGAAVGWGADVDGPLYLGGLALLLLGLALGGYALVRLAPLWLRTLVTVATPVLGYVVWAALWDGARSRDVALLVAGLVLLAAAVLGFARAAGPARDQARGRRAAR